MGRPKPFGILDANRTTILDSIRRVGVQAFGNLGYFRNYFNQNIYEQAQELVLGTSSQVSTNDANVYYDDAAGLFKDKAGATVTLNNYDRVAMIVDTADDDIDFPAGKTIEFIPYDEVDLDSNILNLAGEYTGELRVNNGSVVISGTSYDLSITGTATVDTSSMTGTVIINGVLVSVNSDLTTPTIDDGSNIDKVNSVKDQGGIATNGLKCKVIEIGDWDMNSSVAGATTVNVTHGLTTSDIRIVQALIRHDTDGTTYPIDFNGFAASGLSAGFAYNSVSAVTLKAYAGAWFDSTNFDSTSYNRGWVTIWYAA